MLLRMSAWTDVWLTVAIIEDAGPEDGPPRFPAIEIINREIGYADRGGLFVVQPPPEWHGPTWCFAGSFKSLDRQALIEAVEEVNWCFPELVQLFLREEDDRGFGPNLAKLAPR